VEVISALPLAGLLEADDAVEALLVGDTVLIGSKAHRLRCSIYRL